jgi:hypothetical protein
MPQSPRTRHRSPRARGLGGSRTAYTDWVVVKTKKHTVTGRTVEGGLVRLVCSCGTFEKRVKRDQAFVTAARHANPSPPRKR